MLMEREDAPLVRVNFTPAARQWCGWVQDELEWRRQLRMITFCEHLAMNSKIQLGRLTVLALLLLLACRHWADEKGANE